MMTYTHEQFERLIEVTKEIAKDRTTSLSADNWEDLNDALAPFLHGADLGLVKQINQIRTECCSCPECDGYDKDAAIIAAVREHDGRTA